MANVNVTSDAWTEISITSGTVQNISATADIELSAEQTDNSGVVLKPSELYQWDNETIYARAVTEDTGALRVVNFKKATGGGGYVLPVATASKLGGVKIGGGLAIDENGVLSAPVNYSTTEQQIGTWIDGKPLYQKVLNVTTPSTANTYSSVADISGLNIDAVVTISGIVNIAQGKYVCINYNSGADDVIFTYITNSNTSLNMYVSSTNLSKNATIILQYTKTTD